MPKIKPGGYGIVEVQKTGIENALDAIASGFQSFLQVKEQKKKKDREIQDMIEDLEKRRMDFLRLDPELQDQIKTEAPGIVADLFDNSRILRLQGKKVPKHTIPPAPTLPPTRPRTTTERLTLDQKFAEVQKAKAEAQSATSNAALTQATGDMRLAELKDPTSAANAFYARTGKMPTMDELQASMLTDPQARTAFNQKIQGTLEYKQAKSDEMFKTLQQQHQPTTQAEIDALKKAADYIAGLSQELPVKLPPSLERQRLSLEQAAQKTREEELGVSRAQLARTIGESKLRTMQILVDNGMTSDEASKATDTVLQTGFLPTGVQIPADKKEAAQLQIAELQKQKLQAEIQEAAVLNPKVKVLLDAARLEVSDALPGQYGLSQQRLQSIFDAAGIPYKVKAGDEHWLKDWLGGIKTKVGGMLPTTTGAPATAPAAPAAPAAVPGKQVSPETAQSVSTTVDNWNSILRTSTNEAMVAKIRDRLNRLRAAIAAGDDAAVNKILAEQ